jgi:hypothetical protein
VILLSGQFDAQAYLPTQPPPPLQDAWLPLAYEDQGWRGCAVAPSRQGTAPCLRVAGLPRLEHVSRRSRPAGNCSCGLSLRKGQAECHSAPHGNGKHFPTTELPRPPASVRKDASHARLLPQCLFPLPLRSQQRPNPQPRNQRNQRLRRIHVPRPVRMGASGDCTNTPTISVCTRRAASSSRHR